MSSQESRLIIKNNRFVKKNKVSGTEFGPKLVDVAGLLPTPTTRDSKAGQSPSGMTRKDVKSRADQLNNLPVMLGKHTQQTGEISQQLNPQFVLEMMGFPVDWTELPFLSGETSQSKQQETQSFPK
jgi:hypothetical protein